MRVQIAQPVASGQQLQAFFQQTLPGRENFTRGGSAVVGAGLLTGVVVKPDGPNAVSLGWEIPNIGVKLLMVLAIVAGILPGLILWGIVWLVISGDVEQLKQEVAQALTTGAAQPGMAPMAAVPSRPGKPGAVALTFGVIFVLMGLAAFAFSVNSFDRAESADRFAASARVDNTYGGYRSVLGPEFWYSRARRRREQGTMAAAGGVFNLLVAVGLFVLRRSKVRAWEAANPVGMMGYPQQQMGYPQQQQGYPQQQQGYPQQQMGYPQAQQGYPQQQAGYPQQQAGYPQQAYGQAPTSAPNPYGQAPQGQWPPPGGYPPGGQGPTQG